MNLMDGDRPWFDLRDLSVFLNNPSDNLASTPAEQLIPGESLQDATEMAIAPNGTLQLITSTSQNAPIPHASCSSQSTIL